MSHARATVMILAGVLLFGVHSAQAASLKVAWDAPTDGVAVGYVLSYGTASTSYVRQIDVGLFTAVTVTDLAPGTTYFVVVQAYNEMYQLSDISSELVASTAVLPPGAVLPAPPSALVATLRDGHFIDLQWKAAVSGTPTYRVEVGTAAGLSNVSSLSAETATTRALGPLDSDTYYIRVRSVTSAGVSIATNEVVVVCADEPAGTLAAPRDLLATLRDGRFIDLTWQTAVEASAYRVEVGIAPGETFTSFTTGVTNSFTIADLAPGTYFIRVRSSRNQSEVSTPSNEVVVSATRAENAPRNLAARLIAGKVVRLTWSPPSDASEVVGYMIEAGTGPGRSDIASIPVDGLEFMSPPVPDGTYFLRVRSRKLVGIGAPSDEVGVQVGVSTACVTPPGVPHLVAVTVGPLVQLSWVPGVGNAPTGYVLDVGSTPGRRDIATMQFGAETTTLSAPAANGTYSVRLTAVNACGAAQSSDEAVAVGGPPPTLPGAPIGLDWHAVGRVVTLTWSPPATGGDGTRYVIEATDTAGNPIVTLDTGNLATEFLHGNVPPGAYVVRVRQANAAGLGATSNAVTVVVSP